MLEAWIAQHGKKRLSMHPISVFDTGWQPEILSPIAQLPGRLYDYSILFTQKICTFWRLVLECFHKQKTTKITLNLLKIIEMHLNSSSQCIQLAMQQVNKQEKKQLRQREKFKFVCTQLWDSNSWPSAYTLSVVPAHHYVLHRIYVNLLCMCRLFLASTIYDCINMYTIAHGQGYSSSRAGGKKITDVSEQQYRWKLSELKTHTEKALWFSKRSD